MILTLFANPKALYWIPIVLGLGWTASRIFLKRQRRLTTWIDPKLWNQVIPDFSAKVARTKGILIYLSLLFFLLAVAQPQWGEREEIIQSEGMDVLILLDVSNSMNAEDVPPSRILRAQSFMKRLLQALPRDRVGIVAFAQSAYLAAPLTNDFGYLVEMTETLSPAVIQNQGTNITNAIDTTIQAFQRSGETDQKTSRGVIMITDAEDFGKGATDAAQKLKDFGAGFVILTVGGTEGAPIPIRNEAGILQTYKKNERGQPILTRVDKNKATEIAEAAGGSQVDLVNPDDGALVVAKLLNQWGRSSQKDQKNVIKIDRFIYFLSIGFCLFLLTLFLGYRRPRWKDTFKWPRFLFSKSSKKTLSTQIILILSVIASSPRSATAQSLDSYLKNKKGERAYQSGDFEGAAQSFDQAHNQDRETPEFQFNTGTALAKSNRAEEAATHFNSATKKALEQGRYDIAAKSLYNEGLALKESKKIDESYDRLTKAIEMARLSQDPDLEKRARAALAAAAVQEQQQKQQGENPEDQENKKNKDKRENQDQKGDQKDNQSDGDQDSQSKQDQKNKSGIDTKKREFKSGTLSKDVAEGIMNDLSDKEKQLYNRRLKGGQREQRGKEAPNGQDW
jgi:Ca-activated chloride channel family protein